MLDVGGVGEVYGGTFPARTWHDFMSNALANLPAAAVRPTQLRPAARAPLHHVGLAGGGRRARSQQRGGLLRLQLLQLQQLLQHGSDRYRPEQRQRQPTVVPYHRRPPPGATPLRPPSRRPPSLRPRPPPTTKRPRRSPATRDGRTAPAAYRPARHRHGTGPASPPAVPPARAGRAGSYRTGAGRDSIRPRVEPAPLVTRSPSSRRWPKPIWPPSRGEPRRSTSASTADGERVPRVAGPGRRRREPQGPGVGGRGPGARTDGASASRSTPSWPPSSVSRDALAARRQAAAAALAVAAEAGVDEEMARLADGRAEAARSVPADLLGVYDRLRARLGRGGGRPPGRQPL